MPINSRLVAGKDRLRARVTWPVLARSTGIGEIEGGELVLVPPAHAPSLLGSVRDLAASGIAALVIAGHPEGADLDSVDLPVVAVPPSTNLRELQAEVERYIGRRRRDLFALDQDLHRTLVDGAIGGSDLKALVALAARRAGTQILVDRDGDLTVGRLSDPVAPELLGRARAAVQGRNVEPVLIPGDPAALAVSIVAGREFHGIVLAISPETQITDEHEVVVVSLASAAAILLGREPNTAPEPLGDALRALELGRDAEARTWIALALSDPVASSRRLQRALRAELAARESGGTVAAVNDALVILVPGGDPALAESMIAAARARTGSSTLRAGIGRRYTGTQGPRRSSEQALAALDHAPPGATTDFDSVEMEVLWHRDAGWLDFSTSQLGPLLGSRPDEQELLRSLHVYLDCGRNAKAAAQALQVHRNTLQYRLRRIESILGRSLDDPDTLFALELACRIEARQDNRR
jgi:hypothetical protein